jgi:dTMP kinase
VFVSFEGLDGSGKTTQAGLLTQHLESAGRDVVATREPGGTELGERIRELLLGGGPISPSAEASLFAAARAELVEAVIAPALKRGADVVCDRFLDSSLAYQGVVRGLGIERVLELNRCAFGDLLPHRTFVLDVDAATGARRQDGRPDRIEREGLAFQAAVAEAYLRLAGLFPERIELLDASQPPETIAAIVRASLGL